ncbi:hypothetical protein [Candidatus Clostridium radicumherbarum]|uniref:Uncharacterized protein n=1 Tax=Candidatus Clostridium radicumherbarum TaxID=3381662 RepID=A0ABW8TY51_9CLOT
MNKEYIKKLKKLVSNTNLRNNQDILSVDIKLASNQKDDAQRVKEYIYERISYKRK